MKSWRAEISLVLVTFIWGSTFVLVKSALGDVSTLLFLALRFLLASFVLGVFYRQRLSGIFAKRGFRLKGGALAGACVFGGYVFQTFGLRFTTPSKSAFLTGLAIVLVPLLNSAVYRVAPKISEGAGVVVATIGMGLMTLEGSDFGANPGDLLTVAGAFLFAMHILMVGHYSPRIGFEQLSVVQISTAAALALSTCWWAEDPHIQWSVTLASALLITGVLATAAAFTIQAWAQQRTSPTRTALIFAAEPVFAWCTSYVVTGELLTGRTAAGAAMILAGILMVELKPFGARKHLRQ